MPFDSKKVSDDVRIEFTDGTVVFCSPRWAVYILRGLDLKLVKNGKAD